MEKVQQQSRENMEKKMHWEKYIKINILHLNDS